jgi:pilus assembly protein Flp/PilA
MGEENTMKDVMYKLSANLQALMVREEGQDLVEYALLVALVSLGAVTALSTLAVDINSVFTTIGTKLTSAAA